MLNFVYNTISWVLSAWHKVFGTIVGWIPGVDGPHSGLAWVLSIVFLVVTIRVVLYIPALKQMRSMQAMQTMAPAMKTLQAKYKNDRQRLALEMQKLRKEHDANPLMGCLPALIQIPVFMGLFQVLRSFNKMSTSMRGLGLTAEQTRASGNYLFSPEAVRSFLDARFLGTPLSGSILLPKADYAAFVPAGHPIDFTRLNIILIAVPLMLISAGFIHINARLSLSRQTPEAAAQPQAAMMSKMTLWVFPFFILATGCAWSVGLLVYMVTNNIWTFFQTRHIYHKMDAEESIKLEKREQSRANLAPRPGAKPHKTSQPQQVTQSDNAANDDVTEVEESSTSETITSSDTKPVEKQPKTASRSSDGSRKRKKKKH